MTSRAPISSYRDLDVWKISVDLIEGCYRLTSSFPRDEVYGLTSQIRRAAVSITSNIAEGYGRDQTGPYIQFLRISQGSAREFESLLIVSARLGLATPDALKGCADRCESICKMLRTMIRTLEAKRHQSE